MSKIGTWTSKLFRSYHWRRALWGFSHGTWMLHHPFGSNQQIQQLQFRGQRQKHQVDTFPAISGGWTMMNFMAHSYTICIKKPFSKVSFGIQNDSNFPAFKAIQPWGGLHVPVASLHAQGFVTHWQGLDRGGWDPNCWSAKWLADFNLGGAFKCFLFSPYMGKWSNLTNIFQMGWNHQLVMHFSFLPGFGL